MHPLYVWAQCRLPLPVAVPEPFSVPQDLSWIPRVSGSIMGDWEARAHAETLLFGQRAEGSSQVQKQAKFRNNVS